MFGRNHQLNDLGMDFLCEKVCNYTLHFFHRSRIIQVISFFLSCVVFQGIDTFHLSCHIYGHRVVHSILCTWNYRVCSDILSFIPDIILWWFLYPWIILKCIFNSKLSCYYCSLILLSANILWMVSIFFNSLKFVLWPILGKCSMCTGEEYAFCCCCVESSINVK